MKNIILSILFCCSALLVQGQSQTPLFNHYLYQPEFYNPAQLGEGFLGINYRMYTIGVENSPTSYLAIVDISNLLKDNDKIGLGLRFMGEDWNVTRSPQAELGFAYHIFKNSNQTLSAGVHAGVLSQQFVFGEDVFTTNDDALNNMMPKTILKAGFGIRYHTNFDAGHFNLDATLPRLFADTTALAKGLRFIPLIRASYYYDGGDFGLEPIFLLRPVPDKTVDDVVLTNTMFDIAARIYLLEGGLWFGANFRPIEEASVWGLSLGVNPKGNLSIMTSFEIAPVGTTGELGIVYGFNKKQSLDPVLKRLADQVEIYKDNALRDKLEITRHLEPVKNKLDFAERNSNSFEVQQKNIVSAKDALKQAKSTLKSYNSEQEKILGNKKQADKIVSNASGQGKTKVYQQLIGTTEQIVEEYSELQDRITRLEQRIEQIERTYNPVVILQSGNVEVIRAYFQSGVDRLISKPKDMKDVEVVKDGSNYIIAYEYPYSGQSYLIDDGSEQQYICDHILGKINQLTNNGANIQSIQLKAHLRTKPNLWFEFDSGQYDGLLGQSLEWDYDRFDLSTNRTTRSKQISLNTSTRAKLDQEKLAALKLYALRSYFQQKGLRKSYNMSVIGPVSQKASQYYRVEIVVRP